LPEHVGPKIWSTLSGSELRVSRKDSFPSRWQAKCDADRHLVASGDDPNENDADAKQDLETNPRVRHGIFFNPKGCEGARLR
jgi:ankyrin repeat protein